MVEIPLAPPARVDSSAVAGDSVFAVRTKISVHSRQTISVAPEHSAETPNERATMLGASPASGAVASTPTHPCAGRSTARTGVSWRPAASATPAALTSAAISQPDGTRNAESNKPSAAVTINVHTQARIQLAFLLMSAKT